MFSSSGSGAEYNPDRVDVLMSNGRDRVTNEPRRSVILWASFLTLIAAGMGFGVRTGVLTEWGEVFGFTKFELGTITGGGLLGFGIVILLASAITDRIGYKAIFLGAVALHVVSVVLTLAATTVYGSLGKEAAYWCLYSGVFIFAVANGLCEAVINPLVAQLYPENKTHYLNLLHAGWPAGLILGGLVGFCFLGENAAITEIRWEISLCLYLFPALWYGWIILKERLPVSSVQSAGIGFLTMLKEFAQPVLLFLLVLHVCVGYVELGTDSWITSITNGITQQGFMLFIYASAIMFVLRFFAGPIVERINPVGLLCLSAVLGCIGLVLISQGESAGMVWIAVTIYGVGKTFLWPTMLGVVGERFPRGGALTMGALGAAGMLSAGLLGGPGIGYKQDYFASQQLREEAPSSYERYAAAESSRFLMFPHVQGLDPKKVALLLGKDTGAPEDLAQTLSNMKEGAESRPGLEKLRDWWSEPESGAAIHAQEDLNPVNSASVHGGRMALRWTASVPAVMFLGYLLLFLYFRSKGGYRVVSLLQRGEEKK